MTVAIISARSRGLVACHVCGLVLLNPGDSGPARCTQCASRLHSRKPHSLQHSLALLLAAAILYVPANAFPILHTATLGRDESDTILSGIIALWSDGSWPIATLVFVASILVPSLKFVVLGFLLLTTHRGWHWALYDRTVLYRVVDYIGRWSMLDIFVVTLLVALVQFRGLATVEPGPGALAFATVVILMMYAAQAFDPRLMWDRGCSD